MIIKTIDRQSLSQTCGALQSLKNIITQAITKLNIENNQKTISALAMRWAHNEC